MANWLHRSTKQYRLSSDPPLAEQADWICNPDMSAVAGETSDAWIVDGDTVRLPTEQEWVPINAARLAAAKSAKLQAIDSRTASLISNGSVLVNGESISTSLEAQVSMQGIRALVAEGKMTLPRTVSATGGYSYTIESTADLARIGALMGAFVETKKAAGRALRSAVLAAETVAEVDAVVDDRT